MDYFIYAVLSLVIISTTNAAAVPGHIVTHCGKPADVIFAIDTSSSIWPKDFKEFALPFIQNVVSMFDIGEGEDQTRIGAITYSNDVKLEFNLNTYHDKFSLLNAISKIKSRGGNTFTNKALKYINRRMFTERYGAREDVSHIIIILTDGKSSRHRSTIKEAKIAKKNGVSIFAIGVGEAEEEELVLISSEPKSQFMFKVNGYDALDQIKIELALKACEVTLPTTIAPPTTTTTTTTTTIPTTTTTTTTTTTEPRNKCGGKPADIFFILDTSSSIFKRDFDLSVLGFVRDTVSNFDIGQDLTRVGVMTFSDNPRLVIGLDSYDSKRDLLEAINPTVVRYTLGGTNTAEALEDTRKIGFHKDVTRQGVAKIAIVITDGQSWDERKTKKEALLLKEAGVMVYAIGVGKGVKQDELEAIANEPADDFVFSVDGFAALSELKEVLAVKACGYDLPQGDQPTCGSGPVDITFAYDASTMTVNQKRHTLGQLQSITSRLQYVAGDVRLGVTSGDCVPSGEFPISSPQVASIRMRMLKRQLNPSAHSIVKQWRTSQLKDLGKPSSDDRLTRFDIATPAGPKQAMVLLLNRESNEEFEQLSQEVMFLINNGVEVFVILDESVGKYTLDKWMDTLGPRRVLGNVGPNTDYSGYIMEFMCAL